MFSSAHTHTHSLSMLFTRNLHDAIVMKDYVHLYSKCKTPLKSWEIFFKNILRTWTHVFDTCKKRKQGYWWSCRFSAHDFHTFFSNTLIMVPSSLFISISEQCTAVNETVWAIGKTTVLPWQPAMSEQITDTHHKSWCHHTDNISLTWSGPHLAPEARFRQNSLWKANMYGIKMTFAGKIINIQLLSQFYLGISLLSFPD